MKFLYICMYVYACVLYIYISIATRGSLVYIIPR